MIIIFIVLFVSCLQVVEEVLRQEVRARLNSNWLNVGRAGWRNSSGGWIQRRGFLQFWRFFKKQFYRFLSFHVDLIDGTNWIAAFRWKRPSCCLATLTSRASGSWNRRRRDRRQDPCRSCRKATWSASSASLPKLSPRKPWSTATSPSYRASAALGSTSPEAPTSGLLITSIHPTNPSIHPINPSI